MTARIIGKEKRKQCSIRLEPKIKAKLIKKFGTLQAAIDTLIAKIFETKK